MQTGGGDGGPKKPKRLLPRELRQRRKAARFQTSGETAASSAAAPSAEQEQAPNDAQRLQPPQGAAHLEEARPSRSQEPAEEEKRPTGSQQNAAPRPVTTGASALARLSSVYSSQSFQQKRLRLAQGIQVNIPTSFQVTAVPVDLVPKARVIIHTTFPIPFLHPDSRTRKVALKGFLDPPSRPASSQSPGVQWQRALHFFTHPASPLPASITFNRITTTTKSDAIPFASRSDLIKEEQEFYGARLNTWKQAFRDLYFRFRKHPAESRSSFYVRSSEFVVCFYQKLGQDDECDTTITGLCEQEVRDDSYQFTDPKSSNGASSASAPSGYIVCATISQSTSRVRKALLRLNIEYSTPYSSTQTTKRDAGELYLLEEELGALKARQQSRAPGMLPAAPAVHGPDSLLLFQGHEAVHGLYEFLINRKPLSNQDVPELFGLHPFEHGTIQTLSVVSSGQVGHGSSALPSDTATTEGADHTDISTTSTRAMFRSEIKGFCFPQSVAKIFAVLHQSIVSQAVDKEKTAPSTLLDGKAIAIRVYMDPIPGSERLNVLNLAGKREFVLSTPVFLPMEEQESRSLALECTKRRIDSVIVAHDTAAMTIETTAKPFSGRLVG